MHITTHQSRSILRSLCVGSALLGLSIASALAAAPSPSAEIEARYRQERAKCLSGMSNQPRATCLEEASHARDAAKRGQLDDGDAKYRRNEMARCDALPAEEAKDCRARMKGKGTVSGSAESGGIYRELVTREVKPVDPAASAAPAN